MTLRSRARHATGLLAMLTAGLAESAASSECSPGALRAPLVVERAVERARTVDTHRPESRYIFHLRTRTAKLDRDGRVESEEAFLWQSVPIGGTPYRRLIAKDDRSLTPEERREERDREAAFRASELPPSADDDVRFDEELVDRYAVRLVGCTTQLGRAAYAIAFEPKEGRLRERRRIDALLNRVRGEVWIDAATFEIRQVRFALVPGETVRLGPKLLGFLGGLSGLEGRFVRAPVSGGDWLPKRLEVELRGRAFFRSFHVHEETVWDGFAPLPSRANTLSLEGGS